MMNKSMITGLVVGAVAVTAAGAYAGYQAVDGRRSAQVLDVKPLTRVVRTPREVCSDVLVSHRAPTSDPKRVTGAVLGAVAGGVLGNQIGDGKGQTVATVAGAAAGGYAGSKIQKHMQDDRRTQSIEQRCRTAYDLVEKPNGYEVRYRLGDREGIVRVDHAPGRTIPVKDGELVLRELNDPA
ncbi:MAG TPA: glycine zipper 2TM domain-containing protein [Steroidobacteraceae bacterium]